MAIDHEAAIAGGEVEEVDGDAGIEGLTGLRRSGVGVAGPVGGGAGGHINGDGACAVGVGSDEEGVVGTGAGEGALGAASDGDVVSGEA